MKRNLFITQNIEIKREGNTLKIAKNKIPLSLIDNMFLFPQAKLSRGAQNLLLKHGKSIVYIDSRYQLRGILIPNRFDSNYKKRIQQYKRHQEVELAKYIVHKKIVAIEQYLHRSLERYRKKLSQTQSYQTLLGIEGAVSNYMFFKYKQELQKLHISEFQRRAYYPPPDPINSLLSFLYTLYYALLYAQISADGLDPYIGFLHIKRGRHAAFVSDMMEEARVQLTFLSLEILPFIYPKGFDNLALTPEAIKVVLKSFDSFIQNYQNTLYKEFKELL